MQVIQINHIGLQTAQGVFAGLTKRLRAAINYPNKLTIARVHALHAALAGQRELLAMRLQDFAHQGLIGAKAIQGGGVKKGDTVVECGEQHAFCLLDGDGRAIRVAQVHAA